MRQLARLTIVAVVTLLDTTPMAAQQDVPDSVMRVLRTAAVGCEVHDVRRFGSDSVIVTLLDPTLNPGSIEAAEWTLCGNTGGNLNSRELGRAVVQPLWSAWAPAITIHRAIVVVLGPGAGADSVWVRLPYSRPPLPSPEDGA